MELAMTICGALVVVWIGLCMCVKHASRDTPKPYGYFDGERFAG
jgi:hypothetical protein